MEPARRIAVAGATGNVGRHIIEIPQATLAGPTFEEWLDAES
jgi:hypothetical protein